jgi:hypothetical protein
MSRFQCWLLIRKEFQSHVCAGADPHVPMGLHRTPGKKDFLCNLAIFHNVCTPKTMIFISCGTRVHPDVEFSSSATLYVHY